jgi:hypothetical protein
VGVRMYGCCNVLVLVICVIEFTVFCIFCSVFLYCMVYGHILYGIWTYIVWYMDIYCMVYGHIFLLVLSVLPPSDRSIAVLNNNNKYKYSVCGM